MRCLFITLTFFFISYISCTEPDYTNPLDPASKNYTPSQPVVERSVMVVDFENDSTRSIWGYGHDEFGLRGGKIIKSYSSQFIVENKPNRVLRLDYDVSDSLTSQAFWFQPLGSSDSQIGSFNSRTMGLKSLSFFARGLQGGEKFGVTLSGFGTSTSPDFEVSVSTTWEKKTITLNTLTSGGVDPSQLISLNFVISNALDRPSQGTLLLDEITFEWD